MDNKNIAFTYLIVYAHKPVSLKMYGRLNSLFNYNLRTAMCNLILIQQPHQTHGPMTYYTNSVYQVEGPTCV